MKQKELQEIERMIGTMQAELRSKLADGLQMERNIKEYQDEFIKIERYELVAKEEKREADEKLFASRRQILQEKIAQEQLRYEFLQKEVEDRKQILEDVLQRLLEQNT